MTEPLYFLVFLLISFSIGRRLLSLFRLKTIFIEEVVFGICLGYFIIGYITFFLGIAGMLYEPIFFAVFILGLFISLFDIKYLIENTKKMVSNFNFGFNLQSILLLILLFFVLLNLIVSMAPVWNFAATSYHFAIPKIYIRAHSIMYIPYVMQSNLPFFTQMLYLFGMLVKNAILAELIGYSFGIILVLAIISFSKRFFNLKVGLFGALIFFLIPHVMENIARSESDIICALFSFVSFYAFVFWFKEPDPNWLLLSAIFLGVALSIKYLAGITFFILLLFLSIRLVMIKNKKWAYKVVSFFLFVLIPLLIFIPWLIKNYVYTGNPTFPLLYNLFGGKYLSNAHFVFITSLGKSLDINLINYILLPWYLTMSTSKFPSIMGIGPIFLAFIPLLFILGYKKSPIMTLLSVFSFLGVSFWFLSGAHYIRYMTLVFPFLSILSASVIVRLTEFKSTLFKWFIFAFLFSNLVFNLSLWAGMNLKLFPVVFGFESKDQFYGKLKDYNLYDASQFINKNTPINSKILLVKGGRGYFLERDYIVYPAEYLTLFSGFKDDGAFFNYLKDLDVTHIVINHNFDNNSGMKLFYTSEVNTIFANLTYKHSERIYDKKGIEVFRLK